MAFSATGILIVRPSGSDSNGGGFNPGNANFSATGSATSANTSAPVFTASDYTFVAGDVGARLFLKSGTNVLPAWYTIASVSAGLATLTASIGSATIFNGTFACGLNSTVNVNNSISGGSSYAGGCSNNNTATLSANTITWGLDYSNQDTGRVSFTDMIIGATTTRFTSVGNPVGKNYIGNYINVVSGSGFTVQRVEVASTSTLTATCDKSLGSAASTGGTGTLGGAMASPGMAGRLEASAPGARVASNDVFVKSGTYVVTSTSANVSVGTVSDATGGSGTNSSYWEGFGTIPRDLGTAPLIQLQSALGSGLTVMSFTGNFCEARNITVDANSNTTSTGFNLAGSATSVYEMLTAKNFTTNGMSLGGSVVVSRSAATGGTSAATAAFNLAGVANITFCEAYGNACPGFLGASTGFIANCISSGNSGASSDGFSFSFRGLTIDRCTSYGNGRHGFNLSSGNGCVTVSNSLAEANAGYGFTATGGPTAQTALLNCGAYNNTSGAINIAEITSVPTNFIYNTTGSFFNNAASGDFSLNSTANQGALARAAGYPGAMPRGTSTGFADAGAIQHADPSGGSTTLIIVEDD